MNNATLNYVIKVGYEEKILSLFSQPLYSVDKYTSSYLNERDFIANSYIRDRIMQFELDNGNRSGRLSLTYAFNAQDRQEIPLLFNQQKSFYFEDDPYSGQTSEIEKARKLLFNSKNQLFVKLVISSRLLEKFNKFLIDIPYKTESIVHNQGIKTVLYNNKHYIKFEDLFKYRLLSKKLGSLREVYEDMLFEIKKEIMTYDEDSIYFYNRQFKVLIDEYINKTSEVKVRHLKIKEFKINAKYKLNKIYRS